MSGKRLAAIILVSMCIVLFVLGAQFTSASPDNVFQGVNEFVKAYEYSVGDYALLRVDIVVFNTSLKIDGMVGLVGTEFLNVYLNISIFKVSASRVFLNLDLYIEDDGKIKYFFRDVKAEKDIVSPFIYIYGKKGIFLPFTSPDFIQPKVYEYVESLNNVVLEGNISIIKNNGYVQAKQMYLKLVKENYELPFNVYGGSHYILIVKENIYVLMVGADIVETSIPSLRYVPRLDVSPYEFLVGWIMLGLFNLGVPYPVAFIIGFLSFPLILLAVLLVVWRFFRRRG